MSHRELPEYATYRLLDPPRGVIVAERRMERVNDGGDADSDLSIVTHIPSEAWTLPADDESATVMPSIELAPEATTPN